MENPDVVFIQDIWKTEFLLSKSENSSFEVKLEFLKFLSFAVSRPENKLNSEELKPKLEFWQWKTRVLISRLEKEQSFPTKENSSFKVKLEFWTLQCPEQRMDSQRTRFEYPNEQPLFQHRKREILILTTWGNSCWSMIKLEFTSEIQEFTLHSWSPGKYKFIITEIFLKTWLNLFTSLFPRVYF